MDFESLSNTYGDFKDHNAKIKIGGKELVDLSHISSLVVELTALYDAGSCLFEIKSVFKAEKSKLALDSKIAGLLKLGEIVEVELGYAEAFSPVFKGYIDSIDTNFTQEDGFSILVECLDAKGIMMNNYKSEIKKDINKYSEAAAKVFKDYSGISGKQRVTASSEVTGTIEQHNESDYDFVVRLAKKLNYSFYIICDEIIFEPVAKDKGVFLKAAVDKYVISFAIQRTLEKMVSKVIARNSDEQNPAKCFEGVATAYDSIGESGSVSAGGISTLLSKTTRVVIDPSIDSDAAAKSLAEATLSRLAMNVGKGKIEFVGVPDMVPGKILAVGGLGTEYDKSYYISKVVHTICGEYYRTTCEINGNKF